MGFSRCCRGMSGPWCCSTDGGGARPGWPPPYGQPGYGHTVVAVDTGEGEQRAAFLTTADGCAPLVERARELGGGSGEVIVAGQSFGGLACVELATHCPGLVSAVIAQSPSLWFAGDPIPDPEAEGTLLRGLVRLLRPTSGQVLLDGDDLHRIPTRQVATTIGLLPQQPLVPAGLTVAELVSRGRHPHRAAWRPASRADHAAVAEAMERTDTLALADRPVTVLFMTVLAVSVSAPVAVTHHWCGIIVAVPLVLRTRDGLTFVAAALVIAANLVAPYTVYDASLPHFTFSAPQWFLGNLQGLAGLVAFVLLMVAARRVGGGRSRRGRVGPSGTTPPAAGVRAAV